MQHPDHLGFPILLQHQSVWSHHSRNPSII
jgi:hypothetical protein